MTLNDELDISRGDVITDASNTCEIADKFFATIMWLNDKPLLSGRQYTIRSATTTAICSLNNPKHLIDINTMTPMPTKELALNEIGEGEIYLNKPIAFEPYTKNKTLGSFILIDRISNETVACGWLRFALRRSGNIFREQLKVTPSERGLIKGHRPCVIWLTGISGAGKSTIANELEQQLNNLSMHTALLDGDNIRHGLNKDLGFTERDRSENIRRIGEVSKLMLDAGLITIVSFISPFEHEREMVRELIGKEQFFEIFVDVSIAEAEKRDVKGLYKKARNGEIKNFTGIDSPYQKPKNPNLHIDAEKCLVEDSVAKIISLIKQQKIINE